MPGGAPGSGQRRRHSVEPVDAADLLRDVLGDRDVEPEYRREHVPGAVGFDPDLEAEPLQDRLHLLQGDVDAQDRVDLLGPNQHPDWLLGARVDVSPVRVHAAAADLCQERRRPPGACQR